MSLSNEEVRHVALLARLGLSDEQVEKLESELNSILGHIEQISKLDLEGVEPMTHPVPMVNSMREDEIIPSLSVETALMNAPAREGDAFLIPRIVGPGGGE